MNILDRTDRRLIDALTRDGRASITALAGDLNLSRATVQARIDRLRSDGVIRRFTVETDLGAAADRVRAVMMIAVEGAQARRVTRILRQMPEITALHTTNGIWDLVAHIDTGSLPEFDQVLREVRDVTGVTRSETCLLLDVAIF